MADWTKLRRTAPPPVLEGEVLPPEEDVVEPPSSGPDPAMIAGGAAVGAGALYGLSRLGNAPGLIGRIGKLAGTANAVRQQLMLSGFAPIKSLLGNIGTGVEQAAEGKGLGALKEILSARTAKEAIAGMRSGGGMVANPTGSTATVNLPGYLAIPGRVMSGADEATRAALQRAGLSAKEAENAVLQSPLQGNLGEVLESPTARYVHPFRRTPFNQFIEGYRKLKAAHEGDRAARRGLAIYGTAGAAHGAATADEQYPLSVPLGVAASARYGLPYAIAALIGRTLAKGKGGGGIAGSALPVSEYGFEQSLTDPLKPFEAPAALRAIERMGGR